jgi:hypothetical protein
VGGRAAFSGLLFPCSAVRVAGPSLSAPTLSRRGLARVGDQGLGRRSDLDRCFDRQPEARMGVCRVGVVPSLVPGGPPRPGGQPDAVRRRYAAGPAAGLAVRSSGWCRFAPRPARRGARPSAARRPGQRPCPNARPWSSVQVQARITLGGQEVGNEEAPRNQCPGAGSSGDRDGNVLRSARTRGRCAARVSCSRRAPGVRLGMPAQLLPPKEPSRSPHVPGRGGCFDGGVYAGGTHIDATGRHGGEPLARILMGIR